MTYIQVLCTCPGLRLSQALYDVTQQQRSRNCSLSLGVIVTSLLRVNAYDVAMTFLRDVYVNSCQRGQCSYTAVVVVVVVDVTNNCGHNVSTHSF